MLRRFAAGETKISSALANDWRDVRWIDRREEIDGVSILNVRGDDVLRTMASGRISAMGPNSSVASSAMEFAGEETPRSGPSDWWWVQVWPDSRSPLVWTRTVSVDSPWEWEWPPCP